AYQVRSVAKDEWDHVSDWSNTLSVCIDGPSAPPEIDCPPHLTIECDESTDPSNTGVGTAVDNCDPDPLIDFSDSLAAGACPQESVITRTWTATDDFGYESSSPQMITIVDSTAPVLTCSVSTDLLWSPDHHLADVGLTTTVSDNCDPTGAAESLVVEVWSDETEVPDTGDGTGRHAPDAKDIDTSLRLRSERRGSEDGRVYLIIGRAEDGCENVGFGCCTVVVPHDQSKAALDEVAAQAEAVLALVASTPGTTIAEKVAPLISQGWTQHGVSEQLGPHQ
ncbi:MAG: hypothetical protein WBE26_19285, partial [Phycisphaerae bacterium]